MYRRLEEFLSARQATHETVEHPAAVSAPGEVAALHASGHTFAKVLIVKERDGFVMAIVPASAKVDLDRRLLLSPKITMPAGSYMTALRVSSSEFRRLADGRVADFSVPEALVAAGGVARPRRPRVPAVPRARR